MKKLYLLAALVIVVAALLAVAGPAMAWNNGWQPYDSQSYKAADGSTHILYVSLYAVHNPNGQPIFLVSQMRAHTNNTGHTKTFGFQPAIGLVNGSTYYFVNQERRVGTDWNYWNINGSQLWGGNDGYDYGGVISFTNVRWNDYIHGDYLSQMCILLGDSPGV